MKNKSHSRAFSSTALYSVQGAFYERLCKAVSSGIQIANTGPMPAILRVLFILALSFSSSFAWASAEVTPVCDQLLTSTVPSFKDRLKKIAIDKALDAMAYMKGLPKYLALVKELKESGRYLKYENFGEMGLAEIGISVRYSQAKLEAMNTGRPLIIIGNHHLGIADGLALQYLAGRARKSSPSLLFLARWIEKLLPHAIYGDAQKWGTAIPVDINVPKATDPNYVEKVAEIKAFNSSWSRTSTRALKNGAALIVFPAGHVASMEEGEYPANIYDAQDSWQEGFLNLARLGKADIVFAHVDAVNSKAFYRDRKRFGGGDKERVIWFFSEALAKKDKVIDVNFSKPMSLEEVYSKLSEIFGVSIVALKADAHLTAELMRQMTYRLSVVEPQTLDILVTPQRR